MFSEVLKRMMPFSPCETQLAASADVIARHVLRQNSIRPEFSRTSQVDLRNANQGRKQASISSTVPVCRCNPNVRATSELNSYDRKTTCLLAWILTREPRTRNL